MYELIRVGKLQSFSWKWRLYEVIECMSYIYGKPFEETLGNESSLKLIL